ncbi:Glycoside hydrolase [Trema orientale]|uniref:Glycoside hydrolase n=1 Tax=Trema orientale TaxID=63057 RepID=A0A2P5E6M8_TREOI|nr:Glycoside hydrolase [Trema orientale]
MSALDVSSSLYHCSIKIASSKLTDKPSLYYWIILLFEHQLWTYLDYFRDYAELCFKEFGDRVKNWITLNEPWTYTVNGYVTGTAAPGRCSGWQGRDCAGGDSGREPYLVAHHQLLSHATAVQLYKEKYQASQKGRIGITLVSLWFVPYSYANPDQIDARRALDFMFGWFMDPLTNGDYPSSMRDLVRNRLPKFTEEEAILVKGSFDFLGLNYFTAYYVQTAPFLNNIFSLLIDSYLIDARVNITSERNGASIGPKAASDWLYVYPAGIYNLLLYTKSHYQNPLIYITENGVDEFNNPKLSIEQALQDNQRIDYHFRHLQYLQKAIKARVNVKGYFAWSLLDNFEWASGYTVRFGINFVDYKNGQKRYPKLSAHWFRSFLKKH